MFQSAKGEHGRFDLTYLHLKQSPLHVHVISTLHAFDTSGE